VGVPPTDGEGSRYVGTGQCMTINKGDEIKGNTISEWGGGGEEERKRER
jgi:hypothetical protein